MKPESGYAVLIKLDEDCIPVIEDGKLYLITENDSINGLKKLLSDLGRIQIIIADEIKNREVEKRK